MSLTKKIEAFKELNEQNDLALERLVLCSSAVQHFTAPNITEIFESIRAMKKDLVTLGTPSSSFYHNDTPSNYFLKLEGRITKVEKESLQRGSIGTLRDISAYALSPAVRSQIINSTGKALLFLNQKLEGSFLPQDVTLRDLHTPHDLIRYMHGVGTEFFFNPEGAKWEHSDEYFSTSYNGKNMTLRLKSVTEKSANQQLEENIFLRRFMEAVNADRFSTKRGYENFYALVGDNDSLSMQMMLGCHYATLKTQRDERSYRFTFTFTDTAGYNSSNFRTNITENILRSLGYSVKRTDNKITAEEDFSSDKEAADNFEKIIRLAVSLRDVDTLDTSKINGREDDVVAAFNVGVINLYAYLSNYGKGSYVDYAIKNNVYLGSSDRVKQTPNIHLKPKKLSKRKFSWSNVWEHARDDYFRFDDKIYVGGIGLAIGLVCGGIGLLVYATTTPGSHEKVEYHNVSSYSLPESKIEVDSRQEEKIQEEANKNGQGGSYE